MNNISADELHKRLLQMMKEFHSFCVEHNISYYIVAGTALGAKRHKGFIPWDDDIDIGIPRNDYDRLYSLMDKLPKNMELIYYKTRKLTPFHCIKLVDKSTTLIEKYYPDDVEGLYIDIFPLDGAIKDSRKDKIRRKRINWINKEIVFHYATLDCPSLKERIIQKYCKLIKVDKLHDVLNNLMKKVPIDIGDSMGNLLGAYGEREIVDKRIFGEPRLYCFEDTQFFGPEDIDAFLSAVYGDYMKLPEPNQRVLKHGFLYVDLDRSYRDYRSDI